MMGEIKIRSIFQALKPILMAFALAACDGQNDITMIAPGGGNGQDNGNCDKANCKTARDSKVDQIGSLAMQAAGWSEILLLSALGETNKGSFSQCTQIDLRDKGQLLSIQSKANAMGCRRGNDFVVMELSADIERDANGNITKITTRPLSSLTTNQKSLGLDSHLEVTRAVDDRYSVKTFLDLNLIIERQNAYTYKFQENISFKSERTPAPNKLENYAVSEFNVTDFQYSGSIMLKRNDKSQIVTEINLNTEKDENNEPVRAYIFNTQFETAESRKNKKPIDYRSEFQLYEEADEIRLSHCGIPSGRYHYKTRMLEKPSKEAGSAWKTKVDSMDYLEISEKSVRAVIGKVSQKIETCNNQIIGRLFIISNQLDKLFNDFHGGIGAKRVTQKPIQRDKDGKIIKNSNGDVTPANRGSGCHKNGINGKVQAVPDHSCHN